MARLTDLADQEDVVKAFQAALRKVKADSVKALHGNARKAVKKLSQLYEKEKYANATRQEVMLGRTSRRWRQRKLALGKDVRRGHFTLAISKAIRSPQAILKDENGFTYDIARAPTTGTVAGRRKSKGRRARKSRKNRVRDYVRHYEQKKAPGLGTLPKSAINLLDDAVHKATARKLKNIRKSAQRPGNEFLIDIELKLGGLTV